jgi:hypothetical protein
MLLPADWKQRVENWRKGRPGSTCVVCMQSTADQWEPWEWSAEPLTVALVCRQCGHVHVLLWYRLLQLLP